MAPAVKTEPWDIGDQVVLYADFVDETGAAATPADATLQIKTGDGAELATVHLAAMTNPAVGRLEYAFTITKGGRHFYRWAASGAFSVAVEGGFTVNTPKLTTPAP